MKIIQRRYTGGLWQDIRTDACDVSGINLVLVFGSPTLVADEHLYSDLHEMYPQAAILISSTAGEIMNDVVHDETLSLTAIAFEYTVLQAASVMVNPGETSFETGSRLGAQFAKENLSNVFVISDGQHVNGSELVKGLQQALPEKTIITGGLAGDGVDFRKTLVGLNSSAIENCVAAIAFYGSALTVSSASVGGWDPFGPQRLITRSSGNILYELDGQPALDIYKKYLGEYASQLPSAGLLFPLSIKNGGQDSLVRTILAVNEEDSSLVFAGNMPEGYYARLMKAGFDRLIEGASEAAKNTLAGKSNAPDLAVLISCVGRKIVLNQRVDEEVEVIRNVYGTDTAITGFYSYGEISPSYNSEGPELHNQTMTITTFTERAS